jgi:hypothetical protein
VLRRAREVIKERVCYFGYKKVLRRVKRDYAGFSVNNQCHPAPGVSKEQKHV